MALNVRSIFLVVCVFLIVSQTVPQLKKHDANWHPRRSWRSRRIVTEEVAGGRRRRAAARRRAVLLISDKAD